MAEDFEGKLFYTLLILFLIIITVLAVWRSKQENNICSFDELSGQTYCVPKAGY